MSWVIVALCIYVVVMVAGLGLWILSGLAEIMYDRVEWWWMFDLCDWLDYAAKLILGVGGSATVITLVIYIVMEEVLPWINAL